MADNAPVWHPASNRAGALQHAPGPTVILTSAAEIMPKPIDWLWLHWLPRGKIIILAGQPGAGKTTQALSIAATVSAGGLWPDGSRCTVPGTVLLWSSEDDYHDTLVPRLMAAGADLNNIRFVDRVADETGELSFFDPARDVQLLSAKLSAIGGARLLIVDPIVSAVAGDSHKANDVRRNLQPLADLARDHGCAVLGVTHFRKDSHGTLPLDRVIGSQAFGAVARVVLVAAYDEAARRGVLARAKTNLGPGSGGFAYTLEESSVCDGRITTSVVRWREQVRGPARDILGAVEPCDENERSEREEAAAFLADLLADGPVATKVVRKEADGAGHAWRTIERAKRDLGIEAEKRGSTWYWVLPAVDSVSSVEPTEDRHDD
ncbi:AAA family ATPase [Trinickia dabaoshanensis]|uniref:AAA family ATPase n=1 Tax=Trinickia dabaoshanensis TaxID=564714 RepID=UPI001E4E774C|nr:AAA family ATPase [Trinickia dabaoshanensis]